MEFLSFLKQYFEPIAFTLLIILFEMLLIGAGLLGWIMMKNNENIVVSIVGAIMFLIASGYFVVSVLALFVAIFTNIYHK